MANASALNQWAPRALSVLRIVAAFLFMMHGSAKLLHVPHQAQDLQLVQPQDSSGFQLTAGDSLERAAIDLALVRRVVQAEPDQRGGERRKPDHR